MLNFFDQKTRFFIFLCVLFTAFSSCEKSKSDEWKLLDSFLDQNYTFHTKQLNTERATLFEKAKIFSEIKTEEPSILNTRYEKLIKKIDRYILSETSDIDVIDQEYKELLIDMKYAITTISKGKLDTYLLKTNRLTFNKRCHLKTMKNDLTLAMKYVYESFTGNFLYTSTGSHYLRINTAVEQDKRQTKLILATNHFLEYTPQEDLVIEKITHQGFEKKIAYTIVPNHAFIDIQLDSLAVGNYEFEGSLQYFDRNGTITIPFRKEFDVEPIKDRN